MPTIFSFDEQLFLFDLCLSFHFYLRECANNSNYFCYCCCLLILSVLLVLSSPWRIHLNLRYIGRVSCAFPLVCASLCVRGFLSYTHTVWQHGLG